jgi:hypothetical protein
MLRIRPEQMKTMVAARHQEFETNAIAHVRDNLPGRYEALGEEEVRSMIAQAREGSESYGLTDRFDILRYLNHMLVLAPDFDVNPAFPWAQRILTDADLHGSLKMDTLCRATERHLEKSPCCQTDAKPVKTSQTAQQKTWIEIRMLDEDDRPVPNIPYLVKLPDGATREGSLDGAGIARFEEIDAGTCEVSFPSLDSAAWSPIQAN